MASQPKTKPVPYSLLGAFRDLAAVSDEAGLYSVMSRVMIEELGQDVAFLYRSIPAEEIAKEARESMPIFSMFMMAAHFKGRALSYPDTWYVGESA